MTEKTRKPLRILMTADTVGGVWTYALEMARALAPHGIVFDIATMGAPLTPAQWAEGNALSNVRIHESRFKLEWMPDPWDDVADAGEWLLALEQEIRPDIIHLNGFAHGALPFHAPVLMVAHSCVLSWWQSVKGEAAPPEWDRYAEAVRAGLHGARTVAAPTGAMLSSIERHYGPLPADCRKTVIYNSRDPALFSHTAPREKEPIILAAGRLWDEAKNIATLEQAASGLPWQVLLAGDDCGANAALPNVCRLGNLPPPALAHWLSRAAIYALPARYEPFGLSILEAALAGCALVIGDIGSLREVWGDDAACFVPPDDPAALRDVLCRLIANPDERARLSHAARKRALAYTQERMAAGYLEVYSETLAARRFPLGVPSPPVATAPFPLSRKRAEGEEEFLVASTSPSVHSLLCSPSARLRERGKGAVATGGEGTPAQRTDADTPAPNTTL